MSDVKISLMLRALESNRPDLSRRVIRQRPHSDARQRLHDLRIAKIVEVKPKLEAKLLDEIGAAAVKQDIDIPARADEILERGFQQLLDQRLIVVLVNDLLRRTGPKNLAQWAGPGRGQLHRQRLRLQLGKT